MKKIIASDIERITNVETDYLYTISWKMTELCNFHCPNCIAGHPNKVIHNSQSTIEKYALKIKDFIDNRFVISRQRFRGYPLRCWDDKGQLHPDFWTGAIKLHFVGGEPTLYDLESVLKIIGLEQVGKISLVTNFSRNNDYFLSLNNLCKENHTVLKVVASYHSEFGSKDDFLAKVFDLKNRGMLMRVSTIVKDDNFDRNFIDKSIANGVYVNAPRERTLDNVEAEISDESLEFLQSREETYQYIHVYTKDLHYTFKCTAFANNAITDGGLNPNGFTCTAGLTCLRIEPNGDVCRSGCAYCKQYQILGNLADPLYKIGEPVAPIICGLAPEKKCNLSYRVTISKGG